MDSRRVAGIIFVNAHRVSDTSTEALIAHLYRKNRSSVGKALNSMACLFGPMGGRLGATKIAFVD